MLKVIILRASFKIANFTLVFIFYNFVRYFKMTIETDFSKKSSRTFFTFILRSIKMMIQMRLMLIWWPSNPRAEKAFYNIIVMKPEVLYKAIFIDKSFTAIAAVTQKFQTAAYAFPLVRIDVFLSGSNSFLQKKLSLDTKEFYLLSLF